MRAVKKIMFYTINVIAIGASVILVFSLYLVSSVLGSGSGAGIGGFIFSLAFGAFFYGIFFIIQGAIMKHSLKRRIDNQDITAQASYEKWKKLTRYAIIGVTVPLVIYLVLLIVIAIASGV